MDKIQAYNDSESDSDEHQNYKINENANELKSSFFGLESSTPRLFSNKNNSKTDSEENSGLDIPDGDFWKGFVPEEDTMEAQIRSSPTKIEKDLKTDFQISFKSRKRSNHSENSLNRKQNCMNSRAQTNTNTSYLSTPSSSYSNIPLPNTQIRKIYYVHSKITPYLCSKQSCKIALKFNSLWQSHDKAVNRIMWNRSNFSHLLLSAGMDTVVKVWNVWSMLDRCVASISHHSKAVRHAVWGAQGRDIISCSYDKTAMVTDVESGTIKSRYTHPGFVVSCTLHPCNPNCFVTGTENLIQLWDQRTPLSPVKLLTFKDKMGQPQDLLFINNGTELISCSDIASRDSSDRTIMAWDIQSGNVLSNQIFQERYTCTRLKQSISDSHFLAQTHGGYIALFSTKKPFKMNKNKRFEGHEMDGYNIGFDISHDGTLVYSGSAEGGVHCYDYRSGRQIKKYRTENNIVITDVACHPVLPTLIAACTWGGNICLWQ